MTFRPTEVLGPLGRAKTTILLTVVFFFGCFSVDALAQKRFSRSFPAGQRVRLKVMNRTGTITVEGWARSEVNITADRDSPAANIVPEIDEDQISINLVRDNQGRDIGMVNFRVRVPYNCTVDIETRIGNLKVSSVRGGLVRAHISSEGSIELLDIGASNVAAENVLGDIFFDGEIRPDGTYRFSSMRGSISLRIPFNSSFKLTATAPSTRSIQLGPFLNSSMNYLGDGRRVVGKNGDGSATIWITNQRGEIGFFPR